MYIPKVIETAIVYQSKIITIARSTLSKNDTGTIEREVAVVKDSVAIVAVDPERRILLIRQYRHPMENHIWEIPAGRVDVEGESPRDTALRELREEADTTADAIEQLTVFSNSVGWTTERTYVYIAHGLKTVPEFARVNEESDIEKEWLPLVDAVSKVQSGEIYDAKTIIGILLADRFIKQQKQ